MSVYTVKDLMDRLWKLPPHTEIHLMTPSGIHPWNGEDGADPFLVCEVEGNVFLFIDDGEAFHGPIEKQSCSLMTTGAAWDRIERLGK